MKIDVKILCAALSLSVLLGCDFFNSQAKRVEILKLERQQSERVATERKDAVLALKSYIEGRCALVEADRRAATGKVEALGRDLSSLEQAISRVMDGQGESNLTYQARLLQVLKDESVNALAQKYLMDGFSLARAAFMERIREFSVQESKYREAILKCEETYESKIKGSQTWTENSKAQREEEVRRLESEVSFYEKKLAGTRKSIFGSPAQERERKEKVYEYETEIRKKRQQIDRMRDPNISRQIEVSAAVGQQSVHDRAVTTRRQELLDIDRRLKPKQTELDIAREVEAATIVALKREICVRKEAQESRIAAVARKVRLAKECLLELQISDPDGLRKMRQRVDAIFAEGSRK